MCRIESRFESTHSRRSSTTARTWPGGCSPVCSATSSSATTVSAPKSASSDAPRYEETRGSRPATTRATERAVAQSTGSGARTGDATSVTTRASLGLQPSDLHVVARHQGHERAREREREEGCDPVEPELAAAVVDEHADPEDDPDDRQY